MTENQNNPATGNEEDALEQLKGILAEDAQNNIDDTKGFIPKKDQTGIIIRLSTIIVAAILFYVTGFFENIAIVLAVVVLFLIVEAINIMKIRNMIKREKQTAFLKTPGKRNKRR